MKIKLLLLLSLAAPSVWAVSLKSNEPALLEPLKSIPLTQDERLGIRKSNKDASYVKTGRINLVDLKAKLMIINNQRYIVSSDFKYYDGQIESAKVVRFLLSDKNEIIEAWIVK